MNMRVQLSLLNPDVIFFKYMSRSWIAGSYGSSIFNFLRKLHTVFHSGCAIYIPTSSAQGFLLSTSLPEFISCFLFVCLLIAILTGVRWFLTVVLICISLMIILSLFSRTCWPFICLWKTICSNSLPIFSQLFCFVLSCMSSLYTLDINLSGRWFANIFFYSIGCLFILLIVLFVGQKLLIWHSLICCFLLLLSVLLVYILKKSLPRPVLKSFSLCFLL